MSKSKVLPGLGPALASITLYVALALAGLWAASWEPHSMFDPILRWLAYIELSGVALWFGCVGWMLVRYDVWRWLRRKAGRS